MISQNFAQTSDFLRRRLAGNQAPAEQVGDMQNARGGKMQNRIPRRMRAANPAHLDFLTIFAI